MGDDSGAGSFINIHLLAGIPFKFLASVPRASTMAVKGRVRVGPMLYKQHPRISAFGRCSEMQRGFAKMRLCGYIDLKRQY